MSEKRIYLDWASTTPLCSEAIEALSSFHGIGNHIGVNANANSLHSDGRAAFAALEDARAQIARCSGVRPNEVYFTSGATEADNTAAIALSLAARKARAQAGKAVAHPRFLTTAIEHEAVLESVAVLEQCGFSVDILPVDRNGFVALKDVEEALTPDTLVTSIMTANNEVGSIQPLADIARSVHASGSLLHTDAAQAFGKIPLNVRELGVDAVSISAHKIGGPKGVGAFILRSGTPCIPYLYGGGQERGLRSGTQNVAGIVGFAAAAKALAGTPEQIRQESSRQRSLRDYLYERLCAYEQVVASVDCQPQSEAFLPNIVNVCVKGIESESLMLRFDQLGVAVSGGSACSSGSLEPSHVLTALGINRDTALCSLRFSIGRETSRDDIEQALVCFDKVVNW